MRNEKTQIEIDVEIKLLEDMKPKVRRYTAFGDDNQEAIEAQIRALKESADDDDTYEWQDDKEFSEHAADAARQAILWRDGDEDEAPSDGWTPLVRG